MPLNWLKRITKPSSETSSHQKTPAGASESSPVESPAYQSSSGQSQVCTTTLRPEQHPDSLPWATESASSDVCDTARAFTSTASASPCDLEIPAEKIAQRAYEKWVNRGKPIGDPDRDWLEAEQELRQEYQSMTAERLPHRSR